eukprot:6858694-Prymnesium_polylepis.1
MPASMQNRPGHQNEALRGRRSCRRVTCLGSRGLWLRVTYPEQSHRLPRPDRQTRTEVEPAPRFIHYTAALGLPGRHTATTC